MVSRAFLATQPSNLVVLGVIIPSCCCFSSLVTPMSSGGYFKVRLEILVEFKTILSLALIFISRSSLFPPLSGCSVLSWIVKGSSFREI